MSLERGKRIRQGARIAASMAGEAVLPTFVAEELRAKRGSEVKLHSTAEGTLFVGQAFSIGWAGRNPIVGGILYAATKIVEGILVVDEKLAVRRSRRNG